MTTTTPAPAIVHPGPVQGLIRTVRDLRQVADMLDSKFFTIGAMRWFHSRVVWADRIRYTPGSTDERGYFITSEVLGDPEDTPRTHHVRVFEIERNADREIVGVWFERLTEDGYPTRTDARAAMLSVAGVTR